MNTTAGSSGDDPSAAPFVSVVIAAYDAASCVGQAMASAVAQSGVRLELLVVDDASDDDTAAAVVELAEADDRIVLIRNPVNTGPAGARNLALARAKGDWIAVLDSDDQFAAGRLDAMCRIAREQGADIVIDDFISVDPAGRQLDGPGLSGQRPDGFIDLESWIALNSFVRGEVSFGYAKPLISRDFLRRTGVRYNETLRNGEDYHIVLEALLAGAKAHFMANAGYLYTRRDGSISRRADADHMHALLEADKAVAARLDPVRQSSAGALMATRQNNLGNLQTTEEVLGALKARRPGPAVASLVRRPGAIGRVIGHLGEAVQKRIGTRG